MKMCLNWRVLAGLVVLGLGILVLAPGLLGAALPILVVAACPLSMVVMMVGMNRTGGTAGDRCAVETPSASAGHRSREEQLAELRRELDEIQSRQAAIVARMRALEETETGRLAPGDRPTTERGVTPAGRDGVGPTGG